MANNDASYPGLYMCGTTYGATAGIYGSTWYYMGYNPNNVPVNPDFYALFTPEDIRYDAYFMAPGIVGPMGELTVPKTEIVYCLNLRKLI